VIRRHVLAALVAGVTAGEDDAARAALSRTEWVLRRRAKRRLERALIDAALATNELGSFGDPEAARHVLRVAALEVARVRVEGVTDRARVVASYEALRPQPVSRVPVATIVLGLAVIAASAAVVVGVRSAGPGKRAPRVAEGYVRPLPPPAAGAFRDGGVPLRDAAIEQLLVEDFTALVLEADHDRRRGGTGVERKAHSAALEQAAPIVARGPALAAAWSDLLAMLERWVYVPASGRSFKDVARELRAKVRVVSDQLAATGVGIYLEGDVISQGDRAHAIIYSYRVEQVVFVEAGGERRRVLSLRRLDRLNLTKSLLGMQSEELGDPVLLLDQIDEHVTTTVLPVLATRARYPLGDDDWDGAERLSLAAGEAVRRELAAALAADAAAATGIAGLLAERARIVDEWRARLERRNLRLARTDALYLPETMLDDLADDVPDDQRGRVAAIEAELARLGAAKVAARVHDFVASTVRRHEAQHGIDDDRDEPLRYPPALEDLLGPELDHDGDPRHSVERARAELSAYLSQIANDPITPQLALWHVARNVFQLRRAGSAESYAGVLIVEGLARLLKTPATQPVIHGGKIDRDRLLEPAVTLARASRDQLREAARALWLELYDEPFVPIVDK